MRFRQVKTNSTMNRIIDTGKDTMDFTIVNSNFQNLVYTSRTLNLVTEYK